MAKSMPTKAKSDYFALSDDKKIVFLSCLMFYLSMGARASYVEAGTSMMASNSALRAFNEMTQDISKQLMQLLGVKIEAYPHDIFLELLLEGEEKTTCGADLLCAIQEAIKLAK